MEQRVHGISLHKSSAKLHKEMELFEIETIAVTKICKFCVIPSNVSIEPPGKEDTEIS